MIKRPAVKQVAQFGVVGLTAAAVNFLIVVFFVQFFHWHPLTANVVAFGFAFQVSYFGHRRWTFNGTGSRHREAYSKLLTLQLCNLGVSEVFLYSLLQMHIPYQLALLIVLATLPAFTFIISKFWIFR